jgi:hypothetical protein
MLYGPWTTFPVHPILWSGHTMLETVGICWSPRSVDDPVNLNRSAGKGKSRRKKGTQKRLAQYFYFYFVT